MKVDTKLLKTMLSKAGACKPTNILEITNYYEVVLNEEGLTIRATDGTNHLVVHNSDYTQEGNFSVIVRADQFTKLINKTTKADVDLTVKEDYLQVKGNGTYKVEIVENEEFPVCQVEGSSYSEIQSEGFLNAIKGAKNAKSPAASDGVLFSYLVRDECVYSADAIKVYSKDLEAMDLENVQMLIPPNLAALLMVLDGDTVKVNLDVENNKVEFSSGTVTVAGPLAEGVEEYPDMQELFNIDTPHLVKLPKIDLLSAIDRLSLFVGLFDKGILDLVFTQDGLLVSTSSNSNEMLMYETKLPEPVEYVYKVNSKYLQDLVSVADNEVVTIGFGLEDTLKIMTADSMMLLATADDDE